MEKESEKKKNLAKKHMWQEIPWSVTSGKRQYQKVVIKDTQTRIGTGGWREKGKHDRQRKFKMKINKRHNTERTRPHFFHSWQGGHCHHVLGIRQTHALVLQ